MSFLTPSFLFEAVAVLTSAVLGLVAYFNYKYSYWARKGLPSLKPKFPYGNTGDQIFGSKSYGEVNQQFYNKIKRNGYKHAGLYSLWFPIYMPVDPEIIKCILQKDFQHFINHGVKVDEKRDPLEAHLFNLEDEKWRKMRIKMTPAFTSGKMKMMFETMASCTVGLKDIMKEAAENKKVVDIKDVLGRFTTDIIGSVAFGVECDTLKNPNSEFRKYGKKIFEVNQHDKRRRKLSLFLPKFLQKGEKFKVTKPDVERFFIKVIEDIVAYREKNNATRKDFLQMLLELKNKGFISNEDKPTSENEAGKGLTTLEVAAQAFVFFLAGFETSSTTMTFALLELARNPDIQDKLREEITTVLGRHGGELSYTAIMEMSYMDKVVNETLRKFPPVPLIIRKCNKDYTIPNTDITIEKGTSVFISNLGLQRDPEYYPDPEKFEPERFSEENKRTRPDCTFLAFGEGPRQCIGLRFGVLQSKVGLAALLGDYKIKLNSRTQEPIQLDPKVLVSSVEGGVWVDVEKIN